MNKSVVFLIGVVVFAAAAGGLYYRLSNDPNMMSRYNWALEQIGVREANKTEQIEEGGSEAAPETRSFTKREQRAEQRDRLELFKLGLDLANVLVGLIGIYLALTSMSARRHS